MTGSARAVLRRLAASGPATRPQIGARLGFSRPTMSAAIAELERRDLVRRVGAVQGPVGRSAAQYRLGPAAGHVIAVDAGSTHVRLRMTSLDGGLLCSDVHRLPIRQFALNEAISAAVAQRIALLEPASPPDRGPLRALGIAIPTRVVASAGDGGCATESDQAETRQNLIFSAFDPPPGTTVVLENNVNCAAVAERRHGAAAGAASFAYVQIGLKIGMGLILDGRLVRGCHGGAGEIGHLSFPFAPGAVPQPGMIEQYLGTEALIGRVRAGWPAGAGPSPSDTAELFSLADGGNPAARAHVARHATDIGALVASCVSVIDPGLVILGGGLGASPLLLPGVRAEVARLSYRAEIRSSTLGPEATVLGIEQLALERALEDLLAGS